jgi:membrane protease YdiL (CAAX protease family)
MGAVVLGRVNGTAISTTRLTIWAAFVLALGGLNLAARQTEGKPDPNILYKYDTAVGGVVQYAIVLGFILALSHGLDRREVFALRRPPSLGRAAGWILLGFVLIVVVSGVLSQFLDAGKDQGLVPDRWEARHAGAFAANFAVIAVLAPIVEELVFRGFGFAAVSSVVGPTAAILWIGVAFGAWHGLLIAFPALASLGAIFALVRLRTNSVYPSMLMHAIFNAASLIAAVTVQVGS